MERTKRVKTLKEKILIRSTVIIMIVALISILAYSVMGALNDSLFTYYDFNATSGNVGRLSYNNIYPYNLTQTGTVSSTATGILGNARGTYSASNYFTSGTVAPINESTSWSVNLWFIIGGIGASDEFIMSSQSVGGCGGTGNYNPTIGVQANTGKLMVFAQKYCTGDYYGNISSMSVTTNKWVMITLTYNSSSKVYKEYINGTLYMQNVSNPAQLPSSGAWTIIRIGTNSAGTGQPFSDGYVDEMGLWNRTLSDSEVTQLYNNGNSTYYPFSSAPIGPTGFLNVNVTNNPSKINNTIPFVNITATINYTDNTINVSNFANATLYYLMNTSLNNGCAVFYGQSQCVYNNTAYSKLPMIKYNTTTFNKYLDDNFMMPAYYPYNFTAIDNNPTHLNYSEYLNHYVKFNIYNFSTQASQYVITLEFDASNTSGSGGSLLIYYCNSTYISGNPGTSSSCELSDSFTSLNALKHVHNNSKHNTIPVTISTVKKTQQSSFVFVSTAPNVGTAWNIGYITEPDYKNDSFQTGDYTAWVNSSLIFDMHVHAMNDYDTFQYYVNATDNGTTAQTSVQSIFYGYIAFPPSAPTFITPTCPANVTYSSSGYVIPFQWTQSSSITNKTFTYQLFYSSDGSNYFALSSSYAQNVTSANITTTLTSGYYSIYNKVCDTLGSCDIGFLDCSLYVCQNNYVKSVQPCTDGIRLINYTDSNKCSQQLDVPSDNGQYEQCTTYAPRLQTDIMLIIILFIAFVICLVVGLIASRLFFVFGAFILGMLSAVFIYYKYDIIAIICVYIVMILCFFVATNIIIIPQNTNISIIIIIKYICNSSSPNISCQIFVFKADVICEPSTSF